MSQDAVLQDAVTPLWVSKAAPLAVITGASSGLGEVFARKLAARGYNLLLAARRMERLEQLQLDLERAHHVRVEPYCVDLADDVQVEDFAKRLETEGPIDVLVNNAGFGTKGWFHKTDYARQVEMHKLHVMATLRLSRAVLPEMIERGSGAIINVASVAGFFRSSGSVSYCATKGWMVDFSEGLRVELDSLGSSVNVQALCPGFTYTEFHDVLGSDRNRIPKQLWMKAAFVVEESLKALARRKLIVVPGWRYKLIVFVGRRLPVWLRLKLETKSPQAKSRA
jgi:short-subunit dehydrogenase